MAVAQSSDDDTEIGGRRPYFHLCDYVIFPHSGAYDLPQTRLWLVRLIVQLVINVQCICPTPKLFDLVASELHTGMKFAFY